MVATDGGVDPGRWGVDRRRCASSAAGTVAALAVTLAGLAPPASAGTSRAVDLAAGGVASAPVAAVPATGFGGYNARVAAVTEIAARWIVPTVTTGSSPGLAATWIGAQGARIPLFIQAGTMEVKPPGGPARYEAFWSDPAHGFHAQSLGTVAPGDAVSASLVRSGSTWTVEVADPARHLSTTTTVAAAPGSYVVAEWIQEDPSPGTVAGEDLPYPSLSAVAFSDVTLNGTAPALTLRDGATLMTNGGGDYVPTAFASGAFSLVPPTGYARTYLLLAGALDRVSARFDALYAHWSQASPTARARAETEELAAIDRFDARLATHRWPSQAMPAVRWIIRRNGVLHWAMRRWFLHGAPRSGPFAARLRRASIRQAAIAVRAALGLPPV